MALSCTSTVPLAPMSIAVMFVPLPSCGCVTVVEPHDANCPPMKSFRTASTDCEERVSMMKLEKHSSCDAEEAEVDSAFVEHAWPENVVRAGLGVKRPRRRGRGGVDRRARRVA